MATILRLKVSTVSLSMVVMVHQDGLVRNLNGFVPLPPAWSVLRRCWQGEKPSLGVSERQAFHVNRYSNRSHFALPIVRFPNNQMTTGRTFFVADISSLSSALVVEAVKRFRSLRWFQS